MSYEFYKIIHIFSIALVLISLGGLTLHVMNGGSKASNAKKKLVMITHGVGLLLLLVSGFGMHAKLGLSGIPLWLVGKLVIWLLFGGMVAIIYKKASFGIKIWCLIPVLVAVASWLAIYKPL